MNHDTSFDIIQESNPVQTVAPINKADNEMLRAAEKNTALFYCRLSVEDIKDEKKNGKEDPSNSIQHQQVMLMQYKMSRPNVQKILYKNVQLVCLF